jgi:hypothetical protein
LPRTERKVIPALHRSPAALLQLNFATVNLLKLRRKKFASKFKNFDEATFAGKFGSFERTAKKICVLWKERTVACRERRRGANGIVFGVSRSHPLSDR